MRRDYAVCTQILLATMADEVRRKSSLFVGSRPEIAATSQVDHSDEPTEQVRISIKSVLIEHQTVRRPRTPYENTYKMKPDAKINVKAIEKIIDAVLKDQLEEEKYDPKATKQVSTTRRFSHA